MEEQGSDPGIQIVKKRRFGLPKWLRPKAPRRRTVIFFVLLILAGSSAAYYYYVYKPTKKVANDQCSTQKFQDTTLRNAGVIIQDKKVIELEKMVKAIQQVPGFENDQNCLYPIVKFYIMTGNATKAREYYEKFLKVYDSKKRIATVFGPNAGRQNELKNEVELQEKYKSQVEKNMFFGPEVSQ